MSRRYCTLDHADKRRELAEQTPYQFWLLQVRRESAGRIDPPAGDTGHRQSTAPGGHGQAPPAVRAARGDR